MRKSPVRLKNCFITVPDTRSRIGKRLKFARENSCEKTLHSKTRENLRQALRTEKWTDFFEDKTKIRAQHDKVTRHTPRRHASCRRLQVVRSGNFVTSYSRKEPILILSTIRQELFRNQLVRLILGAFCRRRVRRTAPDFNRAGYNYNTHRRICQQQIITLQ